MAKEIIIRASADDLKKFDSTGHEIEGASIELHIPTREQEYMSMAVKQLKEQYQDASHCKFI